MLKRTDDIIHAIRGDCLEVMRRMDSDSFELAYLDPPFFTQKVHRLKTRDRSREYTFSDLWDSHREYAEFLHARLVEVHRLLSSRGAVFFHCDRNATHIVRSLLEEIFGTSGFRSEIIWTYRRWSNSQKGLLPAHQTIYYFSKTSDYVFNTIWEEYSPSTNVDQILQERARDSHGKSVYKRDETGKVITNGVKRGVPLSDVWDIPYLNPKARERTGYPTQKPLLLLERILRIATVDDDYVLDPFCGSGTTLVACALMGRNGVGIDVSEDAVNLANQRLGDPIRSESRLLRVGRATYRQAAEELPRLLKGVEYVPVHRNKGIDALVQRTGNGFPVPVRIQREGESLEEAAAKLLKAGKSKNARMMFLVATDRAGENLFGVELPSEVIVVPSVGLSIAERLAESFVGK